MTERFKEKEEVIEIKNIFDALAQLHKLKSGAVGFDKKGIKVLDEEGKQKHQELTKFIDALLEKKRKAINTFQILERGRPQEKKPFLAQLSFDSLEDFFVSLEQSIGGLGCYVKSQTLLSFEDEGKLEIKIITETELKFGVLGKVVLVNPFDSRSGQPFLKNYPVGFSVKFDKLSPEQKEILENFVSKGEIERLRELGEKV